MLGNPELERALLTSEPSFPEDAEEPEETEE